MTLMIGLLLSLLLLLSGRSWKKEELQNKSF